MNALQSSQKLSTKICFFVGFPGVDEDNDIFFQTSQVINEGKIYEYTILKKFQPFWEFLGYNQNWVGTKLGWNLIKIQSKI